MRQFIDLIGILLVIGSFIGMIVCAVFAVIFNFQNPDMTDLRLLIEYPGPTIGVVICLICYMFGQHLLKR